MNLPLAASSKFYSGKKTNMQMHTDLFAFHLILFYHVTLRKQTHFTNCILVFILFAIHHNLYHSHLYALYCYHYRLESFHTYDHDRYT